MVSKTAQTCESVNQVLSVCCIEQSDDVSSSYVFVVDIDMTVFGLGNVCFVTLGLVHVQFGYSISQDLHIRISENPLLAHTKILFIDLD